MNKTHIYAIIVGAAGFFLGQILVDAYKKKTSTTPSV